MEAIAAAARRSALDVASPVVVRAGVVALGYALAVFAGVGLGLWLLISLIGLGQPATGG